MRYVALPLLLAVWIRFTPAELGFPLDDAWIFSVFAANLREHGEWAFNRGEPSAGVTSPLWAALLSSAPGISESLQVDLVRWTRALGLTLGLLPLAVVLPWFFSKGLTGSSRFRREASWALAVLTVCQGVFLFHARSGMETVAFASCGIVAIRTLFLPNPFWCSLALAGLVLLRLEGLLLALPLLAYCLSRGERLRAALLALFSGSAAGLVLFHNWRLCGALFPTTFAGRRFLFKLDPDNLHLERLGESFHKFAAQWVERIHDWCWMDTFLPGGEVELPGGVRLNPLAALLDGLMLLGGLLLLLRAVEPKRWARSAPLFLLLVWTLLHNLFYVTVLPSGGHAGRYQAINFLWPPFLVLFGFQGAGSWLARVARGANSSGARGKAGTAAHIALLGLLLIPVGVSIRVWKQVLDSGIERINHLHLGMGEWARANLPSDSRVVAFDLGGFKMASNLYVIDQSGLLDARGLESFRKHNSPEFYRARRATHLFKFERVEEQDLSIDPVWKTTFALERRISLDRDEGLDREACQNAWSRCSLYRIEYQE